MKCGNFRDLRKVRRLKKTESDTCGCRLLHTKREKKIWTRCVQNLRVSTLATRTWLSSNQPPMQTCTTKSENLDADFQDLRGFFVFNPRSSAFIRVPSLSQQLRKQVNMIAIGIDNHGVALPPKGIPGFFVANIAILQHIAIERIHIICRVTPKGE